VVVFSAPRSAPLAVWNIAAGYVRGVISLPHVSVGAALAASSLLGLSVRTGRVELGRWRWLHHGLYATSLATAAGASVFDGARHRPTWPAAAATLGVLMLMPATRGGSRSHLTVAAAAATVYGVGTTAVCRSS
jgi:hypothetical protein